MSDVQQVRAFLRRTLELTADEVRPLDLGVVAKTPSLPHVWALNHVHIATPIEFSDAVALADEHLQGIPHRYIAVEDERTAASLEDRFRSEGWEVEREVLMALVDPPDREVDLGAVFEPGEEQMLELMRRWHAEEEPGAQAEVLDQLVELSRRQGRAWRERRFGIAIDDAHLAAISKLRSDGATAQVEDVYTIPEARNRGFARTLVTRAAAVARVGGHELIFILADEDDWPKQLYARIGFRPIATSTGFYRRLAR